MPDCEISVSPPSQHAAALHTNPRYSEAEEDHRDAERTDDERPVEPPSPMPMLREGLPAAYRMRHAPHYVEQLMGEAPIQTVRQIALDQIDPGGAQPVAIDVTDLAASIGQVGVLQPLLVTQTAGGRFQLLAGLKRLHAARSAGLSAAPCLVVHADEARAAELRTQAAVTGAAGTAAERETAQAPQDAASGAERPGRKRVDIPLTSALDEIAGALEFVSALLPAASAARSAFQRAMIADVIRVEKGRAAALKAAAFFLSDSAPLQPETFDWATFTEDLRGDSALESRLRGVEVE